MEASMAIVAVDAPVGNTGRVHRVEHNDRL
jgi:hypothetical protein